MSRYDSRSDVIEEFKENIDANLETLQRHITELDLEDAEFVTSIASYYQKFDTLTDNQCYRAARILREI